MLLIIENYKKVKNISSRIKTVKIEFKTMLVIKEKGVFI